jgi:hypothetical protein
VTTRWDVERALRESGLPAPARHVALELLTRTEGGTADVPAEFSPSLAGLASDTGMSRREIAYCLAVLESGGWLTRLRDLAAALKRKQPTSYRLHVPASARAALVASARAALVQDMHQPASARTSARTSAPGAHIQTYQNTRPLSRAPARTRDPRDLLREQGATERETDYIMSKFEGDPAVRYPAVYALTSIGNSATALIEQARRELADPGADDGAAQAPQPSVWLKPWCGQCDHENTRWAEVEQPDGNATVIRCPDCGDKRR